MLVPWSRYTPPQVKSTKGPGTPPYRIKKPGRSAPVLLVSFRYPTQKVYITVSQSLSVSRLRVAAAGVAPSSSSSLKRAYSTLPIHCL